jgi:site-specific recombinase XerD
MDGSPKLLDQMADALRARHYSPRTECAYLAWARRFIYFHHVRHPAEMGEAEINAFLTHLAVAEKVSASTQTQALAALLFLYRQVLAREVGELMGVVRARRSARMPVVMTRTEVRDVLAELSGDKWLIISLLYGCGLRLMEGLRLRVKDLDFSRGEVTVH